MSYLLLNFEFFLSFLLSLVSLVLLVELELELELVELDFGVAVKAYHGAVLFVAGVVECEIGAVVQSDFADGTEAKLVLVPSFFFVLPLLLAL